LTINKTARQIAAHEDNFNQRLIAAALAEFATLLRTAGFPRETTIVNGGEMQHVVVMPSIGWKEFHGDRHAALKYLQTDGLLIDKSCAALKPGRLPHEWAPANYDA
jgi:hypothetical protein